MRDFKKYNEERICPGCGASREVNKYHPVRQCPKCAALQRAKGMRLTDHWSYRGTEHIPQCRYTRWKTSAARNQHDWNISIEEIEAIYMRQQGRCALTGLPLRIHGAETPPEESDYTMSLDRISPDMGYHPDNCQLTIWLANRIKNDLSNCEFATLCRSVVNTVDNRNCSSPRVVC